MQLKNVIWIGLCLAGIALAIYASFLPIHNIPSSGTPREINMAMTRAMYAEYPVINYTALGLGLAGIASMFFCWKD